jgi:hypothetical protein
VRSSPRIDSRLLRALPDLDDPKRPIAETRRRLGELAVELDLPRPSYERVRQLVNAQRSLVTRPSRSGALIDLVFYTAPPRRAFAEVLSPESSER